MGGKAARGRPAGEREAPREGGLREVALPCWGSGGEVSPEAPGPPLQGSPARGSCSPAGASEPGARPAGPEGGFSPAGHRRFTRGGRRPGRGEVARSLRAQSVRRGAAPRTVSPTPGPGVNADAVAGTAPPGPRVPRPGCPSASVTPALQWVRCRLVRGHVVGDPIPRRGAAEVVGAQGSRERGPPPPRGVRDPGHVTRPSGLSLGDLCSPPALSSRVQEIQPSSPDLLHTVSLSCSLVMNF